MTFFKESADVALNSHIIQSLTLQAFGQLKCTTA